MSREVVNKERMGSPDANSMITPPLKPDTWYGEMVAIFYGFFTVNIPINGLKHILSPQIVLFVIWQLLLFYILLVRFAKCIKHRKYYKYELFIFSSYFHFLLLKEFLNPIWVQQLDIK